MNLLTFHTLFDKEYTGKGVDKTDGIFKSDVNAPYITKDDHFCHYNSRL